MATSRHAWMLIRWSVTSRQRHVTWSMAFSEELVVQPTCGEAAVVSWIPPTGGGHRSTGDCVVALSNKAELFCPKVVLMLQCRGGRIWAVDASVSGWSNMGRSIRLSVPSGERL